MNRRDAKRWCSETSAALSPTRWAPSAARGADSIRRGLRRQILLVAFDADHVKITATIENAIRVPRFGGTEQARSGFDQLRRVQLPVGVVARPPRHHQQIARFDDHCGGV